MSSRQKFLYATALSIMALIVISQFAAATQRKDLLTQYVVNNQLSGEDLPILSIVPWLIILNFLHILQYGFYPRLVL